MIRSTRNTAYAAYSSLKETVKNHPKTTGTIVLAAAATLACYHTVFQNQVSILVSKLPLAHKNNYDYLRLDPNFTKVVQLISSLILLQEENSFQYRFLCVLALNLSPQLS